MDTHGKDRPIFVYGTLRDEDVLSLALGPVRERVRALPARLPGYAALSSEEGPFPVLRPIPDHAAPGLVLEPADAEVCARLDFFEAGFDFVPRRLTAETVEGVTDVLVYAPPDDITDTGEIWDLRAWERRDKDLFLEMAREVVTFRIGGEARLAQGKGILRRALARLAAARDPGPAKLRSDFDGGGVIGHEVERIYSGYFALEKHRYRHRLFSGGVSPEVTREVFVIGDAVSVLPWDPRSDAVLLIEQVRAGPIGRGDPNPWSLETIAGLRDSPEPAEETARREAGEEAGLPLGRLERVAEYYSTPGAVSEFVTCFIGEADLSRYSAGTHGLESETEDIRTMVLPRQEAMAAFDRGEARNAPLVVSLLALERERDRLKALWTS